MFTLDSACSRVWERIFQMDGPECIQVRGKTHGSQKEPQNRQQHERDERWKKQAKTALCRILYTMLRICYFVVNY